MISKIKYFVILLTLCLSYISNAQDLTEKKYIKEINKLAKQESINKAFDYILEIEPKTRLDHIMLTEIHAPLGMEQKRAKKLCEMLLLAGADSVWLDKAGNAMGLRRGSSGNRTVAINGHMDTVFPEDTDVSVKIKGDTLFAPGIGDDTRGLMILVTVLRALETQKIETDADLLFIGTVGEEGLGDLKGSKYIFNESGLKIDSWISVDGGSISRIVTKALGSVRYRVNYVGPGGHSWGAFGYVNPIHALSTAINYFAEDADKFTRTGLKTSYNVGRIGGGTSINSVPYHSWAEIDMRSESPEKLVEIEQILLRAAKKALSEHNSNKRSGPELNLDMELVGKRPSGSINPSTPLIQRAMAATEYFGEKPELTIGSTDASIPISKNIPAITIGRGGVGGSNHSLDEWWLNKDGHIAIQYALLILLSEAGVSTSH